MWVSLKRAGWLRWVLEVTSVWFDAGSYSRNPHSSMASSMTVCGMLDQVLLRRCLRPKLFTAAFKVYVRPILEYRSVVWNPYILKGYFDPPLILTHHEFSRLPTRGEVSRRSTRPILLNNMSHLYIKACQNNTKHYIFNVKCFQVYYPKCRMQYDHHRRPHGFTPLSNSRPH